MVRSYFGKRATSGMIKKREQLHVENNHVKSFQCISASHSTVRPSVVGLNGNQV